MSELEFESASASATPEFAFANLKGSICLVQVTEPAGALLAASVRVFRHEFLTIFRFSHRARVHPADLRVLERLDGAVADADADTVFLARGAMERMQRLVVQAQAQADGVRRVQAQAHGAGMRHPYAHPLLHPYQAAQRPGRLAVH